jgi:putative transcriptional regulator
MGEREIKIIDVSRETGLHRNTVTLLNKEIVHRIDLDAIDKLCDLFECDVSELLEKVESES